VPRDLADRLSVPVPQQQHFAILGGEQEECGFDGLPPFDSFQNVRWQEGRRRRGRVADRFLNAVLQCLSPPMIRHAPPRDSKQPRPENAALRVKLHDLSNGFEPGLLEQLVRQRSIAAQQPGDESVQIAMMRLIGDFPGRRVAGQKFRMGIQKVFPSPTAIGIYTT
jgi:hypothetical protein